MKKPYNLRWVMLPVYLIVALVVWNRRDLLFGAFPIGDTSAIAIFVIVGILLNVALVIALIGGLVAVISIIRKPFFESLSIRHGLKKIGFKNCEGEYATLYSKRKDRRKKHGVIYTFNNNGLASEFDRRLPELQTVLNGCIYHIEPARHRKQTQVYAIPRKYEIPTLISHENSNLVDGLLSLLVVGRPNSGKSYALLSTLGAFAQFTGDDTSITICDYKKSSFAVFEDTPNFYGYKDVPDGIRAFYREFEERLEANDEKRNAQKRVLLIDEYGALVTAQEKKVADEIKAMVADMLFMGRSLGIVTLVGVQRGDSEHFKAGARDTFMAILAMGNLSKEQKSMLFHEYKDEMTANNGTGEGYLLIDGRGLEQVTVDTIDDVDALYDAIRGAMHR